jgi:hypothetical protein
VQGHNLGIAIIEPSLLRMLEALWEGPLEPDYLPAIERGIRAILTSPVLTMSRFRDLGELPSHPSDRDIYYEQPFDDHLLDYEFTHPREPHPYDDLDQPESRFLSEFILTRVESEALAALPSWIITHDQASAFLDAWYEGFPPRVCEAHAAIHYDRDDARFSKDEIFFSHEVFHRAPALHAQYLVGCHRAGLIVYGQSPIMQLCSEHLFSKWPDHQ